MHVCQMRWIASVLPVASKKRTSARTHAHMQITCSVEICRRQSLHSWPDARLVFSHHAAHGFTRTNNARARARAPYRGCPWRLLVKPTGVLRHSGMVARMTMARSKENKLSPWTYGTVASMYLARWSPRPGPRWNNYAAAHPTGDAWLPPNPTPLKPHTTRDCAACAADATLPRNTPTQIYAHPQGQSAPIGTKSHNHSHRFSTNKAAVTAAAAAEAEAAVAAALKLRVTSS